jgi:hypothetical protein
MTESPIRATENRPRCLEINKTLKGLYQLGHFTINSMIFDCPAVK